VKLADAIRFGKVSTNVGKKAVCASACFLVFAAGSTKFASYGAQIGVHGASDIGGNETVQSNAATVSMAKVAKELWSTSSDHRTHGSDASLRNGLAKPCRTSIDGRDNGW